MAGVSRSSTVTAAYLMSVENMPLYDAVSHMRSVRPRVKPNQGFLKVRMDQHTIPERKEIDQNLLDISQAPVFLG